MEEFALCWNKLKFAENLSSGFQSLFDRGDFVDCTIACDGQLLQCHKLVLAICSPYFREIFMNNPCRHPIIILKDVTFSIMSELLQFMYQGEVNVKQAELQAFMSIAESLQIKGLATNSGSNSNNNGTNNSNNNSTSNGNNSTMRSSDAMNSSYSQFHSNNVSGGGGSSTANNTGVHRNHNQHQFNSAGNHTENHRQTTSTPLSTTSSIDCGSHTMKGGKHMSGESSTPQTATPSSSSSSFAQKRTIDQISEQQQQRQSQMKMKRSVHDVSDSDMNDSIDNMTSDDIFLPASMQPQVTINESPRFDANCVKRENSNDIIRPQSPGNMYRNTYHSSNSMQNTSFPYFPDFSPNDLSNSNNINDLSKSHMEVPPAVLPGERWFNGKLQFMLSQRGKPLLVHDGFSFGIQYIRKDKKYWQCNLSRKYNCKARVTTTDAGDIIVTNNEHCHTEIRQHLRKDYKMNKLQAQLSSQLNNHHMNFQIGDRKINLTPYMTHVAAAASASSTDLTNCPPTMSSISTTQTSIMPRQITTTNSFPKNLSLRSPSVTPPPTGTPPPSMPPQRRDSNDSPSKCSSQD